jgi:ketosteroid isomerase-like protein
MRPALAPCLVALALAACAHQPAMDPAASLAAAESAFAAHSLREDMRAAFLAHFDTDGVTVRGGWIVSNDFLRARPAPQVVLDWRPQYVEVAPSGEMGLSTGPSKITGRKDPSAAPSYGQFVSVWRRDAGGTWKVAVDLGIGHEGPALWSEPLRARVSPTAASASAGTLAEAESRFASLAHERGARAAYEALGASDLRFYRAGHPPVSGRAQALASPTMTDARDRWSVERSEVARSGDFGYARGAYTPTGAQAPAGWYLRVWRREADGWRIVMDVANAKP